MSTYNKTVWQDGDIITADKMNNIENGIYSYNEDLSEIDSYFVNGINLFNPDDPDIVENVELKNSGATDSLFTGIVKHDT